MDEIAIQVDHISKRFRLRSQERYYTLRDALSRSLLTPFRWLFRGSQKNNSSANARKTLSVEKQGGWFWAVDDVSFTVKQGEIVGIIGRNGAGKSTLLKVLSRITPPSQGKIRLTGRVGSLLEVGTGFHPELAGRENIYLSGAMLGMKKKEIDRKFHEIISFSEIEKFMDMPVKYYSSGMFIRLAFAVAAHLETEILLVDEVLAVGDAAFQKKCLGKMSDVARAGRTILFVSHNMRAMTDLCDRCLWIEQGKIHKEGPSQEIVLAYLSSFERKTDNFGLILPEMHVNPAKDFSFQRFYLLDQDKNPTQSIFYHDPLRFLIEFEVSRPIEGVRLILGIERLDGTLVSILHHTEDDPGNAPLDLQPGRYSVLLETEIPLVPGGYTVHLVAKPVPGYWGMGGSFDTTLDWVERVTNFYIEPLSRQGVGVLTNAGVVRSPARWTFQRNDGNI